VNALRHRPLLGHTLPSSATRFVTLTIRTAQTSRALRTGIRTLIEILAAVGRTGRSTLRDERPIAAVSSLERAVKFRFLRRTRKKLAMRRKTPARRAEGSPHDVVDDAPCDG